jgi:O-methyltransferase
MAMLRRVLVRSLQALRLNRVAHRIYYKHIHGFQPGQKEVLGAVDRCMEIVAKDNFSGHADYLEFGIFKGYTFWYAQRSANRLQLYNMRFFGFDSFTGLPEISIDDETDNDEFYKGQFLCSKDNVVDALNRHGVDWRRTFLIEGFFDKSLAPEKKAGYELGRISIALIDCDLYSSTVEVLQFLGDLLTDGSLLLMDDWNCFGKSNERGQRRAFAEFISNSPELSAEELFSYGTYGCVFRIHNGRKLSSA